MQYQEAGAQDRLVAGGAEEDIERDNFLHGIVPEGDPAAAVLGVPGGRHPSYHCQSLKETHH